MNPEDITEAKEHIAVAVEEAGGLACPDCGETRRHKVQIRRSKIGPYVKCWRCGWHADAITLTRDARGCTFADAVDILLGRTPTSWTETIAARPRPKVVIPPRFEADLAISVYTRLADPATPGIAPAGHLWAEHGIDPAVAEHYGATYVADADALGAHLDATVGHDTAVAAGLTTAKGAWLFAGDYTLVETHTAPSGLVFGVQFRATGDTAAAAKQHKATRGTAIPTKFVPHVLALRGCSPRHLIGCGLNRVAHARPATVHIVEGYKDMLAAASLGMLAYALPGAATVPPEAALDVLAAHQVVLSLDNDDAGRAGAESLASWFADRGVPTTTVLPDEGCDWADMLTRDRVAC